MSYMKKHFDLEEEIKRIMFDNDIVVSCDCGRKTGLAIFDESQIYEIVTRELKRALGNNLDFSECHSIIKKIIGENYLTNECEYCGHKFK